MGFGKINYVLSNVIATADSACQIQYQQGVCTVLPAQASSCGAKTNHFDSIVFLLSF